MLFRIGRKCDNGALLGAPGRRKRRVGVESPLSKRSKENGDGGVPCTGAGVFYLNVSG